MNRKCDPQLLIFVLEQDVIDYLGSEKVKTLILGEEYYWFVKQALFM